MDFNQLRCFQMVAKYGNISRAAKELHITQSGLSKTITRLENELAVTLFEHGYSSITLNEHGMAFLSFANNTLYEYDQCCAKMHTQNNLRLKIAHSDDFDLTMLYDSIRSYYPELRIEKACLSPGAVSASLEEREAEIAYLALPRQYQDGWMPIRPQKWCVAAHIHHPLLKIGSPVRLWQLAGYSGAVCTSKELYEIFHHAFQSVHVNMKLRQDSNPDESFNFMLANDGFCFVPYDVVHGWFVSRPGLKIGVLAVEEPLLDRDICCQKSDAFPKSTSHEKAIEELNGLIRENWEDISRTVEDAIRKTQTAVQKSDGMGENPETTGIKK